MIEAMPEKYTRSHSHERVKAVERMKRDWQALQRRQRQGLVLAEDRCRACVKTSLAGDQLRQLRHGG